MAFNPQATYIGGQLLGQGLANLGQGIGGTIKGYQDIADQAAQSDALMTYLSQQTDPATGKPVVDQKALQSYMQHSARQRAFVAGGLNAGMELAHHLQKYAQENRESLAHTNYYTAAAQHQAAEAAGGGAPGKGKVWSNELGGYATPAQADAARRRTPAGYLAQTYGLTPEQIFNSKIHKAGTAVKDPNTGALKFTPDDKGDQIQIGGDTGVIMPRAEHEVYKRQLQMSGYDPSNPAAGGGAGGAPTTPGARGAPQVGEKRVIQGQQAVWDGTGWKAVTPGA